MKRYFFVSDDPPSQGWSVSILHGTPFRTEAEAEESILKYSIGDAKGCQEFRDFWYVFRGSKR